MGNIIRFLRQIISKVPLELSDYDAKQSLVAQLKSFLEEKMLYAADLIASFVDTTINDGDVILTFGSSPLVRKVLLQAAEQKSFELVVVDTRPLAEGLQTLSALSQKVHCVYSPLSGIAVALQGVNKVVLGASCMLSNGSMLAPAGTAMVACMATALQVIFYSLWLWFTAVVTLVCFACRFRCWSLRRVTNSVTKCNWILLSSTN
jgi:translation initiation factor eIF-2B subunit delta